MGSGSSKAYNTNNNRTPPSPNTNNFPVQSNPKFQPHGNQQSNEWPHQNDMPFSQQFNRNNSMPENNLHYSPNRTFDRGSFYDGNRAPHINNKFNPNVMPLTPTEIDEYRRQGIQFPPYNQSRMPQNGYRVPCDMVNEEDEEYTVTAEEVNFVRSIYERNCGPDGRMDFQQFQSMYQHDYETTRRAFAIMDRDMDGLLNFDDFLLGYCRTRPREEKRQYLQPEPFQNKPIDRHLPFGPLDEYDPYATPIENIAASLKPYAYNSNIRNLL